MIFNQKIPGASNDDFVQCSIFRLSIESPLFCQPRTFLLLVSCKNFNVILVKSGGGGKTELYGFIANIWEGNLNKPIFENHAVSKFPEKLPKMA